MSLILDCHSFCTIDFCISSMWNMWVRVCIYVRVITIFRIYCLRALNILHAFHQMCISNAHKLSLGASIVTKIVVYTKKKKKIKQKNMRICEMWKNTTHRSHKQQRTHYTHYIRMTCSTSFVSQMVFLPNVTAFTVYIYICIVYTELLNFIGFNWLWICTIYIVIRLSFHVVNQNQFISLCWCCLQ